MGGQIKCTSEENYGSTFSVCFPLKRDNDSNTIRSISNIDNNDSDLDYPDDEILYLEGDTSD
jgi:hypothetical protein